MSREDYAYRARFQWNEMLYGDVDVFNGVVCRIPGCLMLDNRHVDDIWQANGLSITRAERKTDVILLCVKHS